MHERRFLDVDSRGRVSVARFGYKDTQLLAIQNDDGSITLQKVVPLTMAELEHFADPAAVEALRRAWNQVESGEARPFTPSSADNQERNAS